MGKIILTDGSVLMNTTFNDAQFVLDAKDKNIILDSCEFNRCTFETALPVNLVCTFCIFKDCQGMDAWYKVILE